MGLLVPPLAGCLALSRFIAALISAVLPFTADQIRKEPSLLLLPPFFFRKGRLAARPTSVLVKLFVATALLDLDLPLLPLAEKRLLEEFLDYRACTAVR